MTLLTVLLLSIFPASTVAAGDVANADGAKLKIGQVFFAQHHVLASDNPLFTLVGNLEALIKVQVYSQTTRPSPAVCARLALGAHRLELPLKGPAQLPKPPTGNPILMEHRYEDSFTAIIPREWIKPGLRVMLELRERKGAGNGPLLDRKVSTTLSVGAPTRLIMTMFDFHFFGGAKGADYPEGWFEELGSKLPVAELELRRVRNIALDKLVMPPRNDGPAVLCSSRAEYQKKTGNRFDGEQGVTSRWNGALKHAAGAGWGGTRRLYYSNIYGVHSGGQAGGLSGCGNGRSVGILLHELGHAFGLPHWAGKKQYPYVGSMYGIPAPGNSDTMPHVGPTWAFDLARRAFIAPTKDGSYKKDPMQGGGAGDRSPYLFKHFSDYSVSRIRGTLEKTQVLWDERAGRYMAWDQGTGSASVTARRRGSPTVPIEHDIEVMSLLASASLVTPEANIVYPPIGPYTAGRIETFDASSPAGHSRARRSGYDESNCNVCLRVTQGGKVRTYLLKDGLNPKDDPKAGDSLFVVAVNVPARDGEVTQADLLYTPGVMRSGVSPACKVLYRWKPASPLAHKTETVTALYPPGSAAIALPNTAAAPLKPSPKVAAPALAAAEKLIAEKQYLEAVTALRRLTVTKRGTDIAKQAADRLKALQDDPAIGRSIIDAEADAFEGRCVTAEKKKDYVLAIKLYEQYVGRFPEASRFAKVKAHLKSLKSDKAIQRTIKTAQVDADCRGWMSLADNYAKAGLNERARQYLTKIVDKYGDTDWGAKARDRLAQIPDR